MSTLTLPAPTTIGTDDDLTHLFCCDDDVAMCGVDLTGEPYDGRGPWCRMCQYIRAESLPCPVKGCVP